jgi:hypothetical protein
MPTVQWVDVPEPESPKPPQILMDMIAMAERGDISDDGPVPFRTILQSIDREKLETTEGRRELCKDDPLMFALVYLPHHLYSKETGNRITFAELHATLIEHAQKWRQGTGELREYRDCYVAPRDSGKTTWLFLLLPLWVGAFDYFKFVAAYSDAVEQARTHLGTFRDELDTNELLQFDFPMFTTGKRFTSSQRAVSQRSDRIEQANGFIFVAKGMSGASLGLKIGRRRPELIILDDIEPGEEKYSLDLMKKRLESLRSKIFYQNQFARVLLIGTVTMPGSIIHQLVESLLHPSEDTPDWIAEENFRVHYFAPILDNEDGTQRSCWPDKWPLSYLLEHEHEREYQKNFLNQPIGDGGDFWGPEDIIYLAGSWEIAGTRTILQIDPAVTAREQSHYTGIAVVTYDPWAGLPDVTYVDDIVSPTLKRTAQGKCLLRYVKRVKLGPRKMRELVLHILELYPDIGKIRVESNQGGDTWYAVLHDMPVKVITHTEADSKKIRHMNMLTHYQRGRVIHEHRFLQFEQLLFAYPNILEDDQIDAASAAIEYFLKSRPKPEKASMRRVSYV